MFARVQAQNSATEAKRKKAFAAFILAIFSCLLTSRVAQAAENCGDVAQQSQRLSQGLSRGNIYTLKEAGKAPFLLFMEYWHEDVPLTKEGAVGTWHLLSNAVSSDPSIYCEVGKGNRVEMPSDEHDARPKKKFGLPDSDLQNCTDNILDGIQMRMWANNELGDSFTFYLGGVEKDFLPMRSWSARTKNIGYCLRT